MPPKEKTVLNTNPVLDEIQKQVMSTSSMLSSSDTGLQDMFRSVIERKERSAESSKQAITLAAERQIGEARMVGARRLDTAFESQRGFATNTALIQQINDQTNKDIKDLESRKQEFIMQGDAASSDKISELMITAYQFKQQSQQQAFTNLLSVASFGQQQNQLRQAADQFNASHKLQQQQQSFNEQVKIAEINTKYGVDGKTLEEAVRLAKPKASAAFNAELAKDLKDSKEETRVLNLASGLRELISDPKNPRTPDMAVLTLFTEMKEFGFTPTRKDYNEAIATAQVEYDKWKIKEDEATASVDNKGIFGDIFNWFSNMQSQDKTTSATSATRATSVQPYTFTQPEFVKNFWGL